MNRRLSVKSIIAISLLFSAVAGPAQLPTPTDARITAGNCQAPDRCLAVLPSAKVSGKVLNNRPSRNQQVKPSISSRKPSRKVDEPVVVSGTGTVFQLYGYAGSARTKALCRSLKDAGVGFIMSDIDASATFKDEMWKAVWSVDTSLRVVNVPVVVADGKVLLTHPTSYAQLRAQLNGSNVGQKPDGNSPSSVTDTDFGDPVTFKQPMLTRVQVFGVERCPNYQMLRKSLSLNGVKYVTCDFEHPAAGEERDVNLWSSLDGMAGKHTIQSPWVIIDRKVVIENPINYDQIKPYLCESNSTSGAAVKIYGGVDPDSLALRKSLNAAGVAYAFFNVGNRARAEEMQFKAETVDPANSNCRFPVADIAGKVFVNHPTSCAMLRPYLDGLTAVKKPTKSGNAAVDSASIQIYGREKCFSCIALRQSLDAQNIAYAFYDVDKDAPRSEEMWKKVHAGHPTMNNVTFPVVNIRGKMLLNYPTSFEELQSDPGGSEVKTQVVNDDAVGKDAIPNVFTSYQRAVLNEINFARTDPAGYAMKRISAEAQHGKDNGAYNDLKGRNRVNPLQLNAQLCLASDYYAKFMAQHNVFGHNESGTPSSRVNAAGYSFHWVGENIAAGGQYDALVSPEPAAIYFIKLLIIDEGVRGVGHRINIFNENFADLGVGFFRAPHSQYGSYTVQDFGAP